MLFGGDAGGRGGTGILTEGRRARRGAAWAGVALLVAALGCGGDEPSKPAVTEAPPAPKAMHDHTPHHGGVVSMVGMLHLEARAHPDGRVQVWLTDMWRRPLPLDDVTGTVTFSARDGQRTTPLAARADALEATGAPADGERVLARVALSRAGSPVEANFVLPRAATVGGAAGIPAAGCVPPPPDPDARGRRPRCIVDFPRLVTVAAAVPGAPVVLIAVGGEGVSAWRFPQAAFAYGFAPPSPVAVPADAAPHADSVGAIAVRPDGREAVLAIENRLPVYDATTGAVVRELPARTGVVRALAWSPAGDRLLVTVFYDAGAHLLAADDGRPLRTLPVEREAAAVAFAADGRGAAVGGELGEIALFDLDAENPPLRIDGSTRAVGALAFVGDRLVAAGEDGTVRVLDPVTGAVDGRVETGRSLVRLAPAPGGRLVASAGYDGIVRLHALPSGEVVEALVWHRAVVWGLAWTGSTLVSGDGAGRVAVWDLADRMASPPA